MMKKEKHLQSSLNSLLVFHEVVKYRSFSKAAEGLFISQPAVTKHIHNLESNLGMALIQRGKGQFSLTKAGKTLLKYTQRISSVLMKIEEALGTLETDRHGQLKIGTTESYSKGLMPRLLSGFQTSFPFIKIALAVGNSEEIEKSLLYYKNDLALIGITKPSSRFESVPFLREDLVLIVSPNHPLAHQQKVSLKELERFPLIIQAKGSTTRKILIQAFKERNVHPSLLIEAASSEFIKKWVAEGKGVSVIVKRIVEEEERMGLLQTIPLVEKLHFEVACLYLKEERSNPSIKTFINFIGKKGKEEIR